MARIRSRSEKTEDIRKEIDSLLGVSLSDEEWDDLVKEFRVDEILNSRSAHSSKVAETAELVRHRRRTYDIHNRPKSQEPRMLSKQEANQPTNRSQVISILVAQEATEDAAVRLFRTEVLSDKLLPLEGVEEWIQLQAQRDGPSTNWLNNVPISTTQANELLRLWQMATPDKLYISLELSIYELAATTHLLPYPGIDGWACYKPTTDGGVLERLRLLSDRLAEKYKWLPGQATAFVLTDGIPLISSITITLNTNSRPLFSRIVLDVDPALSPKEIVMHYRRSRKAIMAARHRNLSEKHMQLAIFDSMRPKTETWTVKMDEWNKTHQAEWKYEEAPNFAHDCLQARRRLLRS